MALTAVPILPAVIPSWVKSEFENGRIAEGRMFRVAPNLGIEGRLVPEAAAAWVKLQLAFKTATKMALTMTGAYRTFDRQVALKKEKGDLAGTPGTSNHGWGCAVDMALGGGGAPVTPIGENDKAMEWLAKNETAHGWSHEHRPFKDGHGPHGKEPWHIRLIAIPADAAIAPPVAPSHVLQRGSQGGNVKLLQDTLRFWGFGAGETNGQFGPKTEEQVTTAQVKLVPATAPHDAAGVYGAATHFWLQMFLNKMFELAKKK
jgi:hypothetical protein